MPLSVCAIAGTSHSSRCTCFSVDENFAFYDKNTVETFEICPNSIAHWWKRRQSATLSAICAIRRRCLRRRKGAPSRRWRPSNASTIRDYYLLTILKKLLSTCWTRLTHLNLTHLHWNCVTREIVQHSFQYVRHYYLRVYLQDQHFQEHCGTIAASALSVQLLRVYRTKSSYCKWISWLKNSLRCTMSSST